MAAIDEMHSAANELVAWAEAVPTADSVEFSIVVAYALADLLEHSVPTGRALAAARTINSTLSGVDLWVDE